MAHSRINSTRAYLKEIGQFPLLTAEEEVALATAWHENGDVAAREKLINCNLRLVVNQAKRYKNDHLSLLDLINEGNLGLIQAADKFDPSKGFRFSTFAVYWIRSAISHALQTCGRNIYIPSHIYNALRKYRQVVSDLIGEGVKEPTMAQIAERMDMTVKELEELLQHKSDTVSLATKLGDDSDDTLEDIQADNSSLTPDQIALIEHRNRLIRELLDELPDRTRTIIKMRYGLGSDSDPAEFKKEHTLEEVGKYIGITRERVRQIEKQTLLELKCKKKWQDLAGLMNIESGK